MKPSSKSTVGVLVVQTREARAFEKLRACEEGERLLAFLERAE